MSRHANCNWGGSEHIDSGRRAGDGQARCARCKRLLAWCVDQASSARPLSPCLDSRENDVFSVTTGGGALKRHSQTRRVMCKHALEHSAWAVWTPRHYTRLPEAVCLSTPCALWSNVRSLHRTAPRPVLFSLREAPSSWRSAAFSHGCPAEQSITNTRVLPLRTSHWHETTQLPLSSCGSRPRASHRQRQHQYRQTQLSAARERQRQRRRHRDTETQRHRERGRERRGWHAE